MKKVISFSLWGDHPKYWFGAKENVKLAEYIYPDWFCRFYIDKNCKTELINSISGNNVEIILVDSDILGVFYDGSYNHSHQGMFWRFLAGVDDDVDVFISRDTDSRLSLREHSAVEEWLISDKKLHIMRDHPHHTAPILGGMWGAKKGLLKSISFVERIKDWEKNKYKYALGVDQDFLAKIIYPLVFKQSLEHSDYNIRYLNNLHKFPSQRQDYEFVGDSFDENNNRHPEYWKIIKNKS